MIATRRATCRAGNTRVALPCRRDSPAPADRPTPKHEPIGRTGVAPGISTKIIKGAGGLALPADRSVFQGHQAVLRNGNWIACSAGLVVVLLNFVPGGGKPVGVCSSLNKDGQEPRGAGVAQLVEHLICNQRVGGSNPFASSRPCDARGRAAPQRNNTPIGSFRDGWWLCGSMFGRMGRRAA